MSPDVNLWNCADPTLANWGVRIRIRKCCIWKLERHDGAFEISPWSRAASDAHTQRTRVYCLKRIMHSIQSGAAPSNDGGNFFYGHYPSMMESAHPHFVKSRATFSQRPGIHSLESTNTRGRVSGTHFYVSLDIPRRQHFEISFLHTKHMRNWKRWKRYCEILDCDIHELCIPWQRVQLTEKIVIDTLLLHLVDRSRCTLDRDKKNVGDFQKWTNAIIEQ